MNPVVLITGAARRIGAEMARILHNEHFNIVLHYQNSEADVLKLKESLLEKRANSVAVVQADLADSSQLKQLIEQAVQKFDRLDCLINNASIFKPTPLKDFNTSEASQIMQCNCLSPVQLSQLASPYLKKTNGNIINITDIHAQKSLKNYLWYSMSKSALEHATLALANELGPDIRVNGVAPGAILWPEHGTNEIDEQQKQVILEQIPLKRCGDVSDIARTVKFLLCDAPYLTGQIIQVDGGRTAVGYQGL